MIVRLFHGEQTFNLNENNCDMNQIDSLEGCEWLVYQAVILLRHTSTLSSMRRVCVVDFHILSTCSFMLKHSAISILKVYIHLDH